MALWCPAYPPCPCNAPHICRAHAPMPEAMPSSLPLTSAASRGTTQPRQQPSQRLPHTAHGGFLPPIRGAPCLLGGACLPRAASPEAIPSSLRRCQNHLALPRLSVPQLFPPWLRVEAALRFGSRDPSMLSGSRDPPLSRLRRQASSPAPLRGVSGNHPLRFWSPETLLRSSGSEACYFASNAGGIHTTLLREKTEGTPSRSNCSAILTPPRLPTALGGLPPTHSGCAWVVLPRAAPSPEAVPSSLRRCQNRLALPRPSVPQLFPPWLRVEAALRFGSRDPSMLSGSRDPPLSRLRRQASSPAPLRGVSGNHPLRFWSPETLLRSSGSEACYFASNAGGIHTTLLREKTEGTPSRSNRSAILTPPQPPTALGGFPPHPFGVFHLHPVVLRSDGTEKSTDVGYHRTTWYQIANSTLQNSDSLRSSAFAHKI